MRPVLCKTIFGLISLVLLFSHGALWAQALSCVPFSPDITQVQVAPDLDVTYIERIPKIRRYIPLANYAMTLPPYAAEMPEGNNGWPLEGSAVTYIAHVKNKGQTPINGFNYTWTLSGGVNQSATGTYSGAALNWYGGGANGEALIQLVVPGWSLSTPYSITFQADPLAGETTTFNNFRTIGSLDITYQFWVEQGAYDAMNMVRNNLGSYSYEDWLNENYDMMNDRLAHSTYSSPIIGAPGTGLVIGCNSNGIAPQGAYMRVRVDDLEIAPSIWGPDPSNIFNTQLATQAQIGRAVTSDDLSWKFYDGRWEATDGDGADGQFNELGYCPSASYPDGLYKASAQQNVTTPINWAMLHESGHQLGIIDIYRLNLDLSNPNAGLSVNSPKYGTLIDYRDTTPAHNDIVFPYPGDFMGGADVLPHDPSENVFSSHSVGFLNNIFNPATGVYQRRGLFGTYLYDTPNTTYIRLVDRNGNPINGATVRLYPRNNSDIFATSPYQTATTGNLLGIDGMMQVQNQPVPTPTGGSPPYYKTEWGESLKPNPYGFINVLGSNGTMFVLIDTPSGGEAYTYLLLTELNAGYYSGCTSQFIKTITVQPQCCVQDTTFNPSAPNSAGVAVDWRRNLVYASDPVARVIRKFALTGAALGTVTNPALNNPNSLAVGPDGYIYVCDNGFGWVVKMDPVLGTAAATLYGPGPLGYLRGVFVDTNGDVYVQGQNGFTVYKFSPVNICGSGLTYLNTPLSLTASPPVNTATGLVKAGNTLYLADSLNGRIEAFQETSPDNYSAGVSVAPGNNMPGRMVNPQGLALDPAGNIYLMNAGDGDYAVFDPNMNYIYDCQKPEYGYSSAIATDPQGNIYVAATGTSGVVKILGGCMTEPALNPVTPLPTPTCLLAAVLSYTPTPTQSPTGTYTSTYSPTLSPTFTATYSLTPTPTQTPTYTPTPTPSPTSTDSPTWTWTPTPTSTSTDTSTPTITFTPTPTPSPVPGNGLPYPNPNDGSQPLQFYYNVAGPGAQLKLKIFTVAFRKIYQDDGLDSTAGLHLYTLDWKRAGLNIANGLYYFVLWDGSGQQNQKVMKILIQR